MRIYRPSFGSLAFPVGIVVYSAYKLIWFSCNGLGLGSGLTFTLSYAAAIVFGGILPIILTYTMKTETVEYFLPRLIIFLCTIAAIALMKEFVEIPKGGLVILTAVSSAVTLLFFYKIRPARFKEWCIIFLSTPTIYMMIYYLLLANDIDMLLDSV